MGLAHHRAITADQIGAHNGGPGLSFMPQPILGTRRKLARNRSAFEDINDDDRVENGCEAFRHLVASSLPARGGGDFFSKMVSIFAHKLHKSHVIIYMTVLCFLSKHACFFSLITDCFLGYL